MFTQNRVKGIIQNECENSVHNLEPTLNIHGLDSLLCFWCASKYFDTIESMTCIMVWLLLPSVLFCL